MVALALFLALLIYYPVIVKEVGYVINKPNANATVSTNYVLDSKNSNVIVATDPNFSIIVPKIGANSKVVPDVDPYNSLVYQRELTKGVAHAKRTVYPGQVGNSFYFAHSSDNFYNANRYNSVFYLLDKMSVGDAFYLVYKGDIYKYKVTEINVVAPDSVKYISLETSKKLATLMTCWPAGTTLKRLVVVGELE